MPFHLGEVKNGPASVEGGSDVGAGVDKESNNVLVSFTGGVVERGFCLTRPAVRVRAGADERANEFRPAVKRRDVQRMRPTIGQGVDVVAQRHQRLDHSGLVAEFADIVEGKWVQAQCLKSCVEALAGKAALRDDFLEAADEVEVRLAAFRESFVGAVTHEQADEVPSILGACERKGGHCVFAGRLVNVGASVEERIGESKRG
mmetsp:Transcript_17703/g.50574  ORF Transcript_17703/g.50574 Transcript_17703/m.50574 type:complete len:203 (-) Transcript_17703:1286-1894(-)